jgi:dolichol-phosphate mannosyltransferase
VTVIAAHPSGGPVGTIRPAGRGSPRAPRQTLVIPTFNERENIAVLLARLAAVLPADDTQIVFVDDSTDDTPQVIEAAAATCPIPVTVCHRVNGTGGLGGAVVEGMRLARGEWIVVMDADLQHPPEVVPDLVAAGRRDGADLVVASRYLSGGRRDGLANRLRRWVSRGSTIVAKVLFRRTLFRVSDPMSGFFAVRASALTVAALRPIGYKILLELIVRTQPARVVEVPYGFQSRYAGESKSSLREGLRFLRHLLVLRVGGRRLRMLGVALIGASGLVPNLAALWLLSLVWGRHYLLAAVVANQVALVWNFLLIELLFRRRRHRSLFSRASRFWMMGNLDLVLRVPALALLVASVHMGLLWGNLATLVGSFLLRFVVLDRLIYTARPARGKDNAVVAA